MKTLLRTLLFILLVPSVSIAGIAFPYSFWKKKLQPETVAWLSSVSGAGGTLANDSTQLADNLVVAIKNAGIRTQVVYLIPFLGSNVAAGIQPLIDDFGVGVGNGGFVNGDFSQSSGLTGNGTSKYLDVHFTPNDIGAVGGIGVWLLANSNVTQDLAGSINGAGTQRWFIEYFSSTLFARWGSNASSADLSGTLSNGDYLDYRSSTTRLDLFKNGTSVANSTVSDSTTPITIKFAVFASNFNNTIINFSSGRFGVFYAVKGSMTTGEIATLHTILQNYLITPTGR